MLRRLLPKRRRFITGIALLSAEASERLRRSSLPSVIGGIVRLVGSHHAVKKGIMPLSGVLGRRSEFQHQLFVASGRSTAADCIRSSRLTCQHDCRQLEHIADAADDQRYQASLWICDDVRSRSIGIRSPCNFTCCTPKSLCTRRWTEDDD